MQWLIYVLAGGLLLYLGRALFVPLSFAALISFILYPICRWMESRRVPRPLSIAAGLALILAFVGAVIALLGSQFMRFKEQWPQLQVKLSQTIDDLARYLQTNAGIEPDMQRSWGQSLVESVLGFLGSSLVDSAIGGVLLVLIPVYVALILYHRTMLVNALIQLFPANRKEMILELLHKTITTYYNFIKGMALVYLVVGILNSLGLWILGIPDAILFGFIASILTFIPYVGIMIGALLPITVAWITFNSIWYPLGVIAIFTVVQYLEANLIFPVAVSQRMNINTLGTIIAMVIGGIIWGGAGMILFIPFAGILKLISDETDELKVLGTLLGSK